METEGGNPDLFVKFYLDRLISGTTEEKDDAAKEIAKIASPSQGVLSALRTQVVYGQSPETVSHSMRLLCGFGDKLSIRTIIKRLASEPGKTRSALEGEAVSSIGIFGGEAFPVLYSILARENDSAACSVTLSLLMKSPSPAHIAPIAGLLGRLHSSHHSPESGNSQMAAGVKKGDPNWDTIQGNSFMAAVLAVEALGKIRTQQSTEALSAYAKKFTGEEKPPYSDVLFAVFDVLFSFPSKNTGELGTALAPKVRELLLSFLGRQWPDSEPLPGKGVLESAEAPENLGDIEDFFYDSSLQVVVPERAPLPPGSIKRTEEFPVPSPLPPRQESPPAFAPPPARDNGPSWVPKPPRAVRGPSRRTPTLNIRPPPNSIRK